MPLYHYQCTSCGRQEQRLGGLDDHLALCVHPACPGVGVMLRTDQDLFTPYFADQGRKDPLWK